MIIEKVSKSGIVQEHFQFSAGSIKIGRAYDNDLILHDMHVDAAHIKLSYDGEHEGFWFEDLSSVNGTQVIRSKENKHRKVPANFISSGDTLCLGKTYLKVRSRVQDVPTAIKISAWDKLLSLSGSVWCVSLQCLALLSIETLDQYLNDPRSDKLGSKFLESFDLLFIVLAYSVAWAFIARVQKAEPRILVHASLAAWCLLVLSLLELVQGVIYFNFNLAHHLIYFNLVINGLCVFFVVWVSLFIATELKPVLRFSLALLIPFGLALGVLVNIFQQPEFQGSPSYDSLVVPPSWQWREGIVSEEYVAKTADLYLPPEETPVLEQSEGPEE